MKALVTGAAGFIGFHIANFLRNKGLHVKAFVRTDPDCELFDGLDIETVKGDVRDIGSIMRALQGCTQLYHVAADYRLWVPDPGNMYETNVNGTRNAMEAALKLGTERVVYTSTVGVFAGSPRGVPADEKSDAGLNEMVGHYKRSKFIAEREVHGYFRKGLPVVIVNPSTPVGQMDRRPTPTGKIIIDFMKGRILAYIDTGLNFVDVEDVAAGHWLAAEHGTTGERYILGNMNSTLWDFFQLLASITGRRAPSVRLPYVPVLLAAYVDEAFSKWITKREPAIPLAGVKMAGKYMYFDCSKAERELHMPQKPVRLALERAATWYEENGYLN